jgi:hypothetical protein
MTIIIHAGLGILYIGDSFKDLSVVQIGFYPGKDERVFRGVVRLRLELWGI